MKAEAETEGRGRGLLMALSGVLVLIILGSGVFGERGVRKHEMLGRELATLRARYDAALAENVRLSAEAQALQESPEYVEWVIRQELGFIRSGERILRLPGAAAESLRGR